MLQTAINLRIQTITALIALRQEWQEAAQGESLLNVEGNVGLFLADLVNTLGLSVHEQTVVLGQALFDEMRDLLNAPPIN
jgi:hypothetical protein